VNHKQTSRRVSVRLKQSKGCYDILVGPGALDLVGEEARSGLGQRARSAVVISNRKVMSLYGKRVTDSLSSSDFKVTTFLIGDGERYKSFATLQRVLSFFATLGLERSDMVVALGGGVVGDLAGLAAALYLRGIPYIQVPTTLLAQIDASVGGKTAVNLPRGKNLVGAFHQPRAVIVDIKTLCTLPQRELTAGWCETLKQGAVGSRSLFQQTRRLLADRSELADLDGRLTSLVASQCRFKVSIVAGDEREELHRVDHRSRRVLNFGHTVGHALEAVTGYRRFKHGEAVGYGMLVACDISRRTGLLKESEFQRLREAIQLCGPLPRTNDLEPRVIVKALQRDKKQLNGHLQWILLESVGRARIVDENEVSPDILLASIREALQGAKMSEMIH
jgi:3-dehydroquinate synthase